MTTTEKHPRVEADLEASPEFALECLYDDAQNPSELTIFPPDEARAVTEWITVDQSVAVSLEEVR
ncbi:MAG: hypothetical protein ABEI11_04485 [Haloarculaceae archaeon]